MNRYRPPDPQQSMMARGSVGIRGRSLDAVGQIERVNDITALPSVVRRRIPFGQRRRPRVGVLDPAALDGDRCDIECHVSLPPGPRCLR